MNKTKKTLLPLIAVGVAIQAFTVIAAEPNETTAAPKAEPNAEEVGKGAPPAWVVTSPEVVKRAEDGDADAMVEIAKGYMELAISPRINADDQERAALRQEAMKWTRRRAKVMADREGDVDSVRKRARPTCAETRTPWNVWGKSMPSHQGGYLMHWTKRPGPGIRKRRRFAMSR